MVVRTEAGGGGCELQGERIGLRGKDGASHVIRVCPGCRNTHPHGHRHIQTDTRMQTETHTDARMHACTHEQAQAETHTDTHSLH